VQMSYTVAEQWTDTDLAVTFVHQYADQRHGGFPMSYTDASGTRQDVAFYLMKTAAADTWLTGDNT